MLIKGDACMALDLMAAVNVAIAVANIITASHY